MRNRYHQTNQSTKMNPSTLLYSLILCLAIILAITNIVSMTPHYYAGTGIGAGYWALPYGKGLRYNLWGRGRGILRQILGNYGGFYG
ncbi:hypothetical protein DERF_007964 [Dermatophagoides farinae]|uniref:Uncharacterized protein n=2 Tax=Dermatophagoides farinae TaxID=6954 RepID=A0A922L507_DERFA|nr:hypothetical protein DERF_007964 [Dermatophagoides farinae]